MQNRIFSLRVDSLSNDEDTLSVKTILEPLALYQCSSEVVPFPAAQVLREESSAMEQGQIVQVVQVKPVSSLPDNNYQPSSMTNMFYETQLPSDQWTASNTSNPTTVAVILPKANDSHKDGFTNSKQAAPKSKLWSDYVAFSRTLCDGNEEVKVVSPLHELQQKERKCDNDGYITNAPFNCLLEDQLNLGVNHNKLLTASREGSFYHLECIDCNSDISDFSGMETIGIEDNQMVSESVPHTCNEDYSDWSLDEEPNLSQGKHHFQFHSHLDENLAKLRGNKDCTAMQDDYIYV